MFITKTKGFRGIRTHLLKVRTYASEVMSFFRQTLFHTSMESIHYKSSVLQYDRRAPTQSFHLQHQPCVLQGSALGQIYLMEQTWQHSPGARQRAVPYEQHITVTWKVCPTALLAKIKRPAYAHLLHIFKSCPLETILEVCFFRRFHFNWQNFPTRLQETQVCLTDGWGTTSVPYHRIPDPE